MTRHLRLPIEGATETDCGTCVSYVGSCAPHCRIFGSLCDDEGEHLPRPEECLAAEREDARRDRDARLGAAVRASGISPESVERRPSVGDHELEREGWDSTNDAEMLWRIRESGLPLGDGDARLVRRLDDHDSRASVYDLHRLNVLCHQAIGWRKLGRLALRLAAALRLGDTREEAERG